MTAAAIEPELAPARFSFLNRPGRRYQL